MSKKFDSLIARLTHKVKLSATQVNGFVVGLSGTDSIVTFMLLSEVAKTEEFSVTGIHYVDSPVATTFIRHVEPWLKERYPNSAIRTAGAESDQERWGLLHEYAANNQLWVASTVNATEKALGTYSILANSASINPIATLYKSEVLLICEEFGVPQAAINASRIPDCICGRDEFAAENIDLIDEVLRYNLLRDYPAELLYKAMNYIRDTKRANDFKSRTPYNI